ncbi:putative manganese-dependent inorganic diphosphatase [Clostridium sp. JN-9]|uniref:putative manganese-dependent inorganic diphosphatase n=1 Tax=Clostridium sp. JN-9 TaxID=2507159 RepID=UPI000FFE2687|nr:putative manganese-dependent inorganic diphosphatase [Clostridium sp. JN-9]QAT39975.1 putative manganese-dependent inorganic diphosphatase [Clostridium sp. JN-9]
MKDVVYISGHKNPDTDSICSAISYAEFKNRTGDVQAIPIRLGELSRETQFILKYFDVPVPELIETVKSQIIDLNIDKVAPISPEISLKMAWSIMKENNVKSLPVTDDGDKLIGLASLSNITSCYMDIWDNNIITKSHTTLDNILDTLAGKLIYSADDNPKLKGKIVVAAMTPDNAKEIIEEGDIVICGDRKDSQKLILQKKASLMIVTGEHPVDEEIIKEAAKVKCSIITTPYDTFTVTRLIPQSVPISYVMTHDNLISFRTDDFVDDVRNVMLQTRFRSYPVVDEHNKVVGRISRYHLISQNKKKVILVDHNERSQSVNGLEDADIIEILDHHRIADIQTGKPIYFRNEPVGCTATIVGSIFFEHGLRPSKKIAGLLCAAIISDTLLFKSPTSTNTDKMIVKRLANIANIDVEAFAKEMFKEGTSLKGRSLEDIFNTDFKTFALEQLKVGVAQVNTMDIEGFEPMREGMLKLMEEKSQKENYDLLILMLTDIIKGGSEMLTAGERKDLVSKAFNIQLTNNSVYVPGVLSRKKQVIPPLNSAIKN